MLDKPKEIPGAPPEQEPIKPQVSNEFRPEFSYRDLELTEVEEIDGYKYLFFMVRGEFIVSIREFEYFNMLSYIFQTISYIQDEGGECICDSISPSYTVIQEDYKITAQKVDFDTNTIVEESDKFIKVYGCYDIIPSIIVGLHNSHDHEDVK